MNHPDTPTPGTSPSTPQDGTHHATSTPDGQEATPGQTNPAEGRTASESRTT